MTAAGRMLRAVREEERRANVRVETVMRPMADGYRVVETSNGAGARDVPDMLSRIRSAATNCPRCGYQGDGDCACPEAKS